MLNDLLACWLCQVERHQSTEIWKANPHCLMWCIWRKKCKVLWRV